MSNGRGRRIEAVADGHRVTTLELFFDLVFVYAITQVTALMSKNSGLDGLAQGLMLLAVLWWCWCCYAWLGTTIRADEGAARLTLLSAMAAMFLVSLTIPEAFKDFEGGLHAPLLFAGCYFFVRLMHLVGYASAARSAGDADLLAVLRRVAPSMVGGTLLLAAAAFTSGAVQLALWGLALLIDYAGVYLAGAGGWRVPSPGHFTERHGLIVIIAIGESIVAIGVGVAELPMSWLVAVTAVLGLAIAASIWWMYFDVAAIVAERRLAALDGADRAAMARDSYTYLHFPMIGGIVLLALGLKKALLYVADTANHSPTEALHGVPLWALTAGVASFLVAHSAFRRRNIGGWNRQRLVVAALLLAVTPLLGLVPAAVAVGVVAAACVLLICYERLRFGSWRKEIRHSHA
ncbi:MAG TPA: low temperature requirement protein A [Pseudonocardiaceae bacterium]|nr:low temperature requirement protein A [Pseudonocardiaceae bacterium]